MPHIAARNIDRLVILPLFPQFSVTTTGDVYASGGVRVEGVVAEAADGDTKVTIGGNLTALGYSGGATGVYTLSQDGNATVSVAGDVYADVGTATHYHADWMVPYWIDSLDKIAQVRSHIFPPGPVRSTLMP